MCQLGNSLVIQALLLEGHTHTPIHPHYSHTHTCTHSVTHVANILPSAISCLFYLPSLLPPFHLTVGHTDEGSDHSLESQLLQHLTREEQQSVLLTSAASDIEDLEQFTRHVYNAHLACFV